MNIFWLMLAGAAGTLARYGLTIFAQNLAARGVFPMAQLPFGTLLVNVAGSFLLALLATLCLRGVASPELRLVLGTGFLGAFTTFSTFEWETYELWSGQQWPALTIYFAGNLVGGLLAILLGRALALRVL